MNDLHQKKKLMQLLDRLPKESGKTAVIGFDAAIDTILRPVKRVDSEGTPEYFTTIEEFGKYISSSAGLSCAIDVRQISKRYGGNMPNLSGSLSLLGAQVSCIGTMGLPGAHRLFEDIGHRLYSVGEAGSCSALQFDDGKVMLSDMQAAEELDYRTVEKLLGNDTLCKLFRDSDVVGFLNWAEMHCATDIWRGVLENIWEKQAADMSKLLLVDLTDCSKKANDEIRQVIDVVNRCGDYRRVVWSFNEKEARQIGCCLQCDSENMQELALLLLRCLNADLVYIHGHDYCAVAGEGKSRVIKGFFVNEPRISVGGGDNFNSGLSFALINGFDEVLAGVFACAVASCFVRDGKSPSLEDVKSFLADADD